MIELKWKRNHIQNVDIKFSAHDAFLEITERITFVYILTYLVLAMPRGT
jgi:hypothetical protein